MISLKEDFVPEISQKLKKLYQLITRKYRTVDLCLWESKWLGDLTVHQSNREMIIIDAEPGIRESIFYYLKDRGTRNIYLDPDRDVMEKYVSEENSVVVIKPLVSRSPKREKDHIAVPALEKILVDLFCEKTVFLAYQGDELSSIFNNAYRMYFLNLAQLFNYSKRRGKEKMLKEFLKNNCDLPKRLSA